jgi:hypothetical protein
MERGLISSLTDSVDISSKISAEVGLFEVDEAFMPKVCRAIKPDTILVTNLFRDQKAFALTRYANERLSVVLSGDELTIEDLLSKTRCHRTEQV